MNAVPFLTAALMVFFPYTLTTEPNGELRMSIVRWAENKGKDVGRVVRLLDNSEINLEPNEPYAIHMENNPLDRDETSTIIWRQNISEPGDYSLQEIAVEEGTIVEFTDKLLKKLSSTWTWSRQHNIDYILNVSQPVSIKVPDDSLVHVESLAKDFWEFKTPLPWDEAEATCRAAGLKLAQPKTREEVEALQKVLHQRIHNRESGCIDATWLNTNGYCFYNDGGYKSREDAIAYCKSKKGILPFPALGNVTAWLVGASTAIKGTRTSAPHAGASKALDGQWLWDDESVVMKEAWTPGKPSGAGDCSVVFPSTGMLMNKDCEVTWQTVCQGISSSHWLGALGDEEKCVKWVDGKCLEKEDHDPESHIEDLWQEGQPGDLISPNYALLLQIQHEKPLTLMETTERKHFLCESACPLGFINFGPQCLLVKEVWLTWREAQFACVKMGLQLYETEEESTFANWLQKKKITGTYWIGGSEKSFTGKKVKMDNIKKLQFICEMTHGTRKMNITNQLSYSDQETVKLHKVVTTCPNRTATVKERTISETYPFSVQMAITGWIWVEYNKPTDEHGGAHCDNNNDWVGGEWCFAHSKWGYSTSYLQNGDQIMAHGDNAILTLNGTVTYIYNEHEVSIDQCPSENSVRESRSIGRNKLRRRSKRSTASSGKSMKNLKARANSQDADDNNKPLMSYIGKRAGEWVRAQAQERKAHLVAYTIDQLSPIVTDMKLENELSELMAPESIFEEEFENTGSQPVITTFLKRKNVANSYRWSVSKGLSVEDSHISSYGTTDTQSASNTFSLANNIAQKEERSQSISQDTAASLKTSEGSTDSEAIGSSDTKSTSDSQISSTGGSSGVTKSKTDSEISTDTIGQSSGTGTLTGGSSSALESDTTSSDTTDISTTSQGTSSKKTQSTKKTQKDSTSHTSTKASSESSSKSNTESQSSTSSTSKGSSVSTGGKTTVSGGASFFGISIGASVTTNTPKRTESYMTSESSTRASSSTSSSSKSTMNMQSTTSQQSTESETGNTSEEGTTSDRSKSRAQSVGQSNTNSVEETVKHEQSQTDLVTSGSAKTSDSSVGTAVEEKKEFENTVGTDRLHSSQSSRNRQISKDYERSHENTNRYGSQDTSNQGTSKSTESSHGSDVTTGLQATQNIQKARTQTLNIDRNEEVETSEEETLETQNEVVIPPNKKVKIEWRVHQRKVRLPWKASIQLTGWINVRFKKIDDAICDIYHDTNTNNVTETGWTYNYKNACEKDNRLYGYPLSYLKDKNYIQQGEGLRFVASGVFEGVLATSHFLRVTETDLGNVNDDDADEDENYNFGVQDDTPRESRRRKRDLRRLPSKVTDYHLEFDEYGNGRANIGKDNRYFRRFHATKKFNDIN